jgi:hypothetical protein
MLGVNGAFIPPILWIPTVEGKRFFLLFRFYGPNKEVFTKEWKLNDLKK